VRVHYKGTLSDGTVFDSSEGRDPLEFQLGEGVVIPGFEQAVLGLEVGASIVKTIPADQAYGPFQEEMVLVIGRDQFPEGMEIEIGQMLQLQGPGGYLQVVVAEIEGDQVTLDGNHPLAGEDLTFAITLDSIASNLIIP
jgi:peptidylprolyl isomerase